MTACPSTSTSSCPGIRQILQAALELFAEHGYEGVSVHAIAERAAVSKANVFHHFASKEALYLAVLRGAGLEWGDEIGTLLDTPRPFAEQLRAFVGVILRQLFDKPAQSRLVLREVLENGELHGKQLTEEAFARNFEVEMSLFRRGQAEGALRSGVDPVIAWITTISACVFFFQMRDVLRFNPQFGYADEPQRYADQVCALLLNGIAADTAPPLNETP